MSYFSNGSVSTGVFHRTDEAGPAPVRGDEGARDGIQRGGQGEDGAAERELKADEVDRFYDFCDLDDDYLLKAEDYDLINTIQQLRNRYRDEFNRPSRISPDPEPTKQR